MNEEWFFMREIERVRRVFIGLGIELGFSFFWGWGGSVICVGFSGKFFG